LYFLVATGSTWAVQAVNTTAGTFAWTYSLGSSDSTLPVISGNVLYLEVIPPAGGADIVALSAAAGTLDWTYAIGFGSLNTTLVAGDGIVTFEHAGTSGQFSLYALDASTGALDWTYPIGTVEATPNLTGSTLYADIAVTGGGLVIALNATTGALDWSYPIGFGTYTDTPVAGDGIVTFEYAGTNGSFSLYALDASTGALDWTYPIGQTISPPVIGNGTLYVDTAPSGEQLNALNTSTGATEWNYQIGYGTIGFPQLGDGVLDYQYTPLSGSPFSLEAIQASDGLPLWSYPFPPGTITGPILGGNNRSPHDSASAASMHPPAIIQRRHTRPKTIRYPAELVTRIGA
jgi:outer membrane protein assembly factor BamB